jgi:demethylmenaquinone methyltransferase / 2-methoxy-6-polyprenyl-1,4-benzoquinol methylase
MMQSTDTYDKRKKIAGMFNDISGRYDLLNHLLSFGIDRRWRRRLILRLLEGDPAKVLDVATGTGDLAIAATRSTQAQITGVDISVGMMARGQTKVAAANLSPRIMFVEGAAEMLPFSDNTFDAVMVAFGVRNFADLPQGLNEFFRVLKPGGKVLILEFSMPENNLLGALYRFYFSKVLPRIGRIISGHPEAYSYLPDSVKQFPYGAAFLAYLSRAGFDQCTTTPLSGGIASLYEGLRIQ